MTVQVLVYSVATGRFRRAVDPDAAVPNVIAYLNQVTITAGEARLVYNKQGAGADTIFAWQAAINAHTGKTVSVGVDANDTYCVVDANGNIVHITYADPACGDGYPNCTLVQSTTMQIGGTYIGGVYTPPLALTISPKVPTVVLGGTQQFTATESGVGAVASPVITWSARFGSIDANGLYTAPAAAPGGVEVVSAQTGLMGTSTRVALQ